MFIKLSKKGGGVFMWEYQKEHKKYYMKEYRKRNKDKIREYNKDYYRKTKYARELVKKMTNEQIQSVLRGEL